MRPIWVWERTAPKTFSLANVIPIELQAQRDGQDGADVDSNTPGPNCPAHPARGREILLATPRRASNYNEHHRPNYRVSFFTGVVLNPATFQAYREARDAGDTATAERLCNALVEECRPFVEKHARKFAKGDLDDLVQAGCLALAIPPKKAPEAGNVFDRYDPSKGSFPRFAIRYIKKAFFRDVIEARPQFSTHSRWAQMPVHTRRAEQAFVAKHGRLPDAAELCVDPDELEAWREKSQGTSYCENNDSGTTSDAAIATATEDAPAFLSQGLLEALTALSVREQRIVLAHALDGQDFKSIAHDEEVTGQYIGQIFTKAAAAMRKNLFRKGR